MTTDRDLTRALQSWLHEDAHENADRVLDRLLDEVARTPQRRAPWTVWRFALARTAMGIGLAAALVVAAVIGFQVLSGADVGGPAPIESPRASPTVLATPSARGSSIPLPPTAFPPSGELVPGSQSLTRWGVSFTLETPASRWRSDGASWITKDVTAGPGGAAMLFWNRPPVNVYADPCNHTVRTPPAGASATDLASAMAAVSGTDLVSGPTDVTVGGYPAKQVVITVRDDIGCAPISFFLWYSEGPGTACGGIGECERYASARGSEISIWIVDVNGVLIVIEGETYAGAGPIPGEEIQRIVDSIRFE